MTKTDNQMNDHSDKRPPLVAIVGRPNVGKSTLFNRLIGRRVAVVHGEAGTTRDRLYGEVVWQGRYFQLVDTGGLLPEKGSGLQAAVIHQAELAIQEADLCLLTVDLKEGLTPLDEEVAKILHRAGRNAIVVMNKSDAGRPELIEGEFRRLGFDEYRPISALHGLGIGELLEAVTGSLPAFSRPPEAERIAISVVGRPNVGKSTLINSLLGRERVIVDAAPGTTRDAIDSFFRWRGREFVLIDTAGLLRKSDSHSAVSRFSLSRTHRSIARADVVLLLLEVPQPPTKVDTQFIQLALERGKSCVIGINKWDRAGGLSQKKYLRGIRDRLPFAGYLPVVFLSALRKQRLEEVMEACEYVAGERRKAVSTGILNRVLHQAREQVAPPRVGGKQFKLYYAVQVKTGPPAFRLFVNDPKLLTPAYRHYLVNRLRQAFGFEGTPLWLEPRLKPRRV